MHAFDLCSLQTEENKSRPQPSQVPFPGENKLRCGCVFDLGNVIGHHTWEHVICRTQEAGTEAHSRGLGERLVWVRLRRAAQDPLQVRCLLPCFPTLNLAL